MSFISNSRATFNCTLSTFTQIGNDLEVLSADTPSPVVSVGDDDSLRSALAAGGSVSLADNITVTSQVNVTETTTLSLNGFTLSNPDPSVYGAILCVQSGATLTIDGDGTIDGGADDDAPGSNRNALRVDGGTAIINGGTFTVDNGLNSTVYVMSGEVVVNGGTFMSKTAAASSTQGHWLLNCLDSSYKDGTAKISVRGGRFYDFNPADNKSEGASTNFVDPSYVVTSAASGSSTVYSVAPEVLSTYELTSDAPSEITVGSPVTVNVTLSPSTVGNTGYPKCQFQFDSVRPEGGDITFKATDSLDQEFSFTNSGTWGPPEGFPVSPDYTATTAWKVSVSIPGDYSVQCKLVDLTSGSVICESNIYVTGVE